MSGVMTIHGDYFSHNDHCILAALILIRLGHDKEAAAERWRRVMDNGTTVSAFMELAVPGLNLLHVPRKLWN